MAGLTVSGLGSIGFRGFSFLYRDLGQSLLQKEVCTGAVGFLIGLKVASITPEEVRGEYQALDPKP